MTWRILQATLVAVLTSMSLSAQETNGSSSQKSPTPYGNGEEPGLSYAGASMPRNLLFFSLAGESGYDDNARSVN